MNIELIDINKILPYKHNPRCNSSSVTKVANSIKEFGWQQPIVVDNEVTIIAGHTRLLAAKELKLKKAPVYIAKDLTTEQVKAYRLADNRLHEDSVWDNELLAIELDELSKIGFEFDVIGFNKFELDKLLGNSEKDSNQNKNNSKELLESEFEEFTHKCPKCNFEWD